nr:MAG TPA: hypothetical protein [Caudoviricetes sp.]
MLQKVLHFVPHTKGTEDVTFLGDSFYHVTLLETGILFLFTRF